MKLDNFVSELHRQYPNGMLVHTINETGYMIISYIKKHLNKGHRSNLYIAHEYLKKLNNKLNANYYLRDIDELNTPEHNDIINQIEKWK